MAPLSEPNQSLRCISKGPSIPSILKNLKIVLPLLVIWGIGCLYSKAFYSKPVCLIVFFIVCLTLYGNLSLGIWRHQQKYGSQVLFLIADPNKTEPFTVSPSAQASRKEPVWQHICLAIFSSIVLTVIYNTFM
jgi:hypothetical protein